jgi:hypothetical protein
MSFLRRAARPFAAYFNRQFDRVSAHVTDEADLTRERLSTMIDGIEDRIGRLEYFDPDAIVEWLDRHPSVASAVIDRSARRLIGHSVGDLPAGVLDLLNWGSSHTSPAAQIGLWFNPPVYIGLQPGGAAEIGVNERIVEVPYALGVASRLPQGSLALDVGAAESTLALSLASLGIETIALDRRRYPLAHPHLTAVMSKIEDWGGPPRPLDAAFCVSTVEHIGLGHYGEDTAPADQDRLTMSRLLEWTADEGVLVFTAPYGRFHVDNFQRTYDADHLDALLEGWKVIDKLVYVQTSPSTWELSRTNEPPSSEAAGRSAVLLQARPRR